MSNTCSQLHMCDMYNTLMMYAHKQGQKKTQKPCVTLLHNYMCKMYNTLTKHGEGKKEKTRVQHLFKTMCKMYYMFYLYHSSIFFTIFYLFLFFFPCFITLAMKIKIS
jgi:hypothetical protein